MKTRQAADTDVGRVRSHNEDAFLNAPPLFAVADGMGGHHAGEVASAVALETIEDARPEGSVPVTTWLSGLIEAANKAVYDEGNARSDGMLRPGTTLTSAFVGDDAIYIGHVGDSRAYLLHGGVLRQITDDHSLVAEWIREGRITEEEALTHPQRSVITRALGIESKVNVDTYRVVPARGDRLLLCSDGLTGFVDETTLQDVLANTQDPDGAVHKLIDLANQAGGEDNITAVIVEFMDDPKPVVAAATAPIAVVDSARDSADANVTGVDEVDPVETEADADADAVSSTATETDSSETAANAEAQSEAEGDPGDDSDVGIIVHTDLEEPEPPTEALRKGGEGRFRLGFWGKFTIWAVLFLIVVVGGWFGVGWLSSNSYYVGVDTGNVAIYTGYPNNILWFDTSDLYKRSNVSVSQLPEVQQKDLADGIAVNSLEDAEQTVENMRELAATDAALNPTTTTTVPPATTAPAAGGANP